MNAYRERQRAKGLRPVQYWVPDLRDPKVREEIRREAAMLSKHPDNAAIDAWIDEWSLPAPTGEPTIGANPKRRYGSAGSRSLRR